MNPQTVFALCSPSRHLSERLFAPLFSRLKSGPPEAVQAKNKKGIKEHLRKITLP